MRAVGLIVDSVRCGSLPLLLAALCAGNGCRGDISSEPPVHLNQNMDQQKRYDPQEPNDRFEDGRGMRPQLPGTVARGELAADDHWWRGRKGGGYAKTLPIPLTIKTLHWGRSRFNIYCSPCHGRAGMGDGIVAKRGLKFGMVVVPNFHSPRLRAMPVGEIFATITNGARTMPSYRKQIPPRDRWAIVAYVRALQVSRTVSIEQVPANIAEQMGWTADRKKKSNKGKAGDQAGAAGDKAKAPDGDRSATGGAAAPGKPAGKQPAGKDQGKQPAGKDQGKQPAGKDQGKQPASKQPASKQPASKQPATEKPATKKPSGKANP